MKEDILKLREEGKSYREISKLLGCSKGSVSYHCGKGQKEKARLRVINYRNNYELTPKFSKKVKLCKNCNKQLVSNKATFCDKTCNSLFIKNTTLDKFKKGLVCSSSTIRNILIEKDGDKCSICEQSSTWNSLPLVLQVDHINGDSDNNFPDNLRLLCPNCHTQTETFTGGNKVKKETRRNNYLRKYKGY